MEILIDRSIYYRGIAIAYFKRFETPLMYVLKFIMGLFIFSSINGFFSSLGTAYATSLDKLSVLMLAAILTSILPPTWVFMLMWLFVVVHIYYISLEFAIIIGLALLCLIFFYIRIFPKESYLIILLLLCFKLKIPYFVPLAAGLFTGPGSVGALIIGALLWYTIPSADILTMPGSSASEINILELPQIFGDSLKAFLGALEVSGPWVYIALVFVASSIAVWMVSRLSVPYSMEIGLGVGGLALLIGSLLGIGSGALEAGVLGTIFSILFSLLLAFICKFFAIIADYSGTERVSFQDDDYLYYVKAVPKIK